MQIQVDMNHLTVVIVGIFFTSVYSFLGGISVLLYPGRKKQEILLALFLFFESLWLGVAGVAALESGSISPVFLFKISMLFYFFAVFTSNIYVIILTTPDFSFRPIHLLNLIIPLIIILLFAFAKDNMQGRDFLSLYYKDSGKNLVSTVWSLALAFYSPLVLYRLYKIFSLNRGKSYSKGLKLFIRLIAIAILQTILWMIDKVYLMGYLWHLYLISGSTIIYASFLAIKYPNFLHDLKEASRQYVKTRINNVDIDTALQQLDSFMISEKPYLNNKLTLSMLAEQLEYTPHQLSELLNLHLKKSFPSFINSYRIADAKMMMVTEKNKLLIEIAHEVGFQSVPTFNRTFKNETGESPSSYRTKALDRTFSYRNESYIQ